MPHPNGDHKHMNDSEILGSLALLMFCISLFQYIEKCSDLSLRMAKFTYELKCLPASQR